MKVFCILHSQTSFSIKVSKRLASSKLKLANILYIFCHHIDIPNSPYILEKILETLTEDELKSHGQLLLLTGVKVFAKSPADSQHILGRIFEICAQNGMEEKVGFYGKLLTKHADLFRIIISK